MCILCYNCPYHHIWCCVAVLGTLNHSSWVAICYTQTSVQGYCSNQTNGFMLCPSTRINSCHMQPFSKGRIHILMSSQPFSGSFLRREPRSKAGKLNTTCLWFQLCGLPLGTLVVVAGEYSERPRGVATVKETFTTLLAKLSRFSLSSRCKRSWMVRKHQCII